jgi:hypothetical protein
MRAHVVRLVGLWILAGALFKLLLGTPADLPTVVRNLPFDLGSTYRVVIGTELFVGLLALLRPGRGWAPAALALATFLGVLVTLIAEGAPSCGCFGSNVPMSPGVMAALDGALLLGLLLVRPWRLGGGGGRDLLVGAALLAVAVAVPLVVNREEGAGPLRRYVILDVKSWVGHRVGETELGRYGRGDEGTAEGLPDGLWLLYRESCEVCAMCLEKMVLVERGDREIVLVRIGERKGGDWHAAVHTLPQGPWVHHLDLSDEIDWVLTAPAEVVVEGGLVRSARDGIEPAECQ